MSEANVHILSCYEVTWLGPRKRMLALEI